MAHILVVDDSADVREFLALVLESGGHRVSQASDASSGLELAGWLRPDVVITDVAMPGTSGLELLTWIGSHLSPTAPPVIVISAFPDTEQDALQRGAALFAPKPLEPDDLLSMTAQVLQRLPPEPAQVERARARTAAVRRRVHQAAEEVVARSFQWTGETLARSESGTRWLASYFGFGCALLLAAQGGAQRVLATSDRRRFPPGQAIDQELPQCLHILEAGSPLLLPDTGVEPSLASLEAGRGIRFFAGVPLVAPPEVRVGSLCLVSRQAHAFSGLDLSILEFLGRRISESYLRPGLAAGERVFLAGNLLTGSAFTRLLELELQAAYASHETVEVALVQLTQGVLSLAGDASLLGFPAPRFALGAVAPERIAIYVRGAPEEKARATAEAAIRALRPVRSAGGILGVHADGPAFHAEEALRLAADALEAARTAGGDGVVRFATQRQSWAASPPPA